VACFRFSLCNAVEKAFRSKLDGGGATGYRPLKPGLALVPHHLVLHPQEREKRKQVSRGVKL
jgi:hypothetical protein